MISPRVSRTYLIQSDREDARNRAVEEATRANARVRVGRGAAVKPSRHSGWWFVTLSIREMVR